MKVLVTLVRASALLVALDSGPSSAQTRSCKFRLDICLKKFARPGTDDAEQCRAAYNQSIKTGSWPAHAASGTPRFPCSK